MQLLPIDPLLPEIIQTIERNTLTLIEAEPGAGKTTRVPAALLSSGRRNVLVLEPRRLPARLAAQRVAKELGSKLGEIVGFQIRFERTGGNTTRLWYLTEGVLVQRLLADQELPPDTVVILDEFHERHLETDLALALLRRLTPHRPDLRIVLMSATLGAEKLVQQLGEGVPVIRSLGRIHSVDLNYTGATAESLEQQVASAVRRALELSRGHVLVFLPGAAEIRRAIRACQSGLRNESVGLFPLYGDLSPQEQDSAIAPSESRKVIFATNVAESSITIEGVGAVVDSGLARILYYSPLTGIARLKIARVSQSSCIQRAGRAGRTGPGLAIRLYTLEDFVRRPESAEPEIVRANLAQTVLQLAAAGIDPDSLPWLVSPPAQSVERARELLGDLGAFAAGILTPTGKRMASAPVSPRLSALVLKASEFGAGEVARRLAAHLAEARLRLPEEAKAEPDSDVDAILRPDLSPTARKIYRQLRNLEVKSDIATPDHALEKAILFAFGDQVARRRTQTLLLCNGGSAQLGNRSSVASEFLVALELDDRSDFDKMLVRIASPIDPIWLLELFPSLIDETDELRWNRTAERVEQMQIMRYRKLVIDETWGRPRDPVAASEVLLQKAEEIGFARWTSNPEAQRFLDRVNFASKYSDRIPPGHEATRSAISKVVTNSWSFKDLDEASKNGMFLSLMEAEVDPRALNEIAPSHLVLPTGRRARIDYPEGAPASVASRLQDFIGLRETPTVAHGTVPLVLCLLAPNSRPVQVTSDLPSFWRNLYPRVRGELSRRYPKHSWPENPA